MRTNLPVTNNEYVLTDSDSIVSITDLQGKITFVNEDFKRISGYREDELMGQPQNIVRHPDMPVEAFADFWTTLKSGRPWLGFVKNRCKKGDYYWVQANATPMYERGQLTGYMSVRGKPSRTSVEAAGNAYALFREGKAAGLKIQDGKVVKTGLMGRVNEFFQGVSLKTRLTTIITVLSVLVLGIGVLGMFGMNKANEGIRSLYAERTVALGQIGDIEALLLTNRLRIAVSLVTPTSEVIRENTAEVEKNIESITKLWEVYMTSPLTSEEKTLATTFAEDRKKFVGQGLKPTINALRAGDIKEANRLVVEVIRPTYKPVYEGILALKKVQHDEAKSTYDQAQSTYISIRNIEIAAIAIGLVAALWMGLMLLRAIVNPMQKTIGYLSKLFEGKYDNKIEIDNHYEIGKVMDALQSMHIKLGFDIN